MVAGFFFFACFNIAPNFFAILLDRGAGVDMVDSPAEIAGDAVGDAKIEKGVVSGAWGLASETVGPTPFDDAFEAFKFVGVVADIA